MSIFCGALPAALMLAFSSASAAPGDADSAFNPGADSSVQALAVQADGKIIVGGDFATLAGAGVARIGRLNADGTLDAAFNPGANGLVRGVLVQADGKIVIFGGFTTVAGTARAGLARLNASGALDTGFDPNQNGTMFAVAQQPDGKLLIGGQFTSIAGAARSYLARLNADGTLDSPFNPSFSGPVYALAVQSDGKIAAGGIFFNVGGQSRNRLARVNADGTPDNSFTPTANDTVRGMTLLPDGKLMIIGDFFQVSGVSLNMIARLNADGTLDTGYAPSVTGGIRGMCLQSDARLFICGQFSTVNGTSLPDLARLNADGTLDASLNANPGAAVQAVAVLPNGRIIAGGDFTSIGGAARNRIARLLNDPAAQTLAVPNLTQAQWQRGGAGPEFSAVAFELSTDGGANWTPLGAGARVGTSASWQINALSLPATGIVRARGRTHGGLWGGSQGIVEQSLAYPASEIVIEHPSGTELADGTAAIAFGSVPVATSGAAKIFTIRNTGTTTLSIGAITKDGAQPGDFSVDTTGMAASLLPGASTAFGVTFNPAAQGARNAALHVANGDGDENPFDIALSGSGVVVTDANLSNLALSAGTLAPAFAPATTSYTASVSYDVSSLTVTPTTADTGATVTVNGAAAASGSASGPIALSVGTNTIQTVVTAFNGTTTKTYTVVVTRAAAVAGDADAGFVADTNAFANGYAVAVQPDGKIIVAGSFTSIGGTARNRIARLNADGTLDTGFNPNADNTIYGAALQPDGKIVIVGNFSNVGGTARSFLARLNSNGTVDTAFAPTLDSGLFAVAVQPDGKILIGGSFTTVNLISRNRIARLNADGTLDSTFNPNVSNGNVTCLALQADGKVLLGGAFTIVGGSTRNKVARVTSAGALDAGFNPDANGNVLCVAAQGDGKVLLGGEFTTVGGTARTYLARTNADGTLDTAFNPAPNFHVQTLALQADGKIVFGGSFTIVSGESNRWRIARLTAAGALDTSFSARANSFVYGLALQADGKILAAGLFSQIGNNPVARQSFARLINDTATHTLAATSSSQVLWTRGGAAPEVSAATFELSTDGGSNWTSLGAATRAGATAHWQLTGLSLPASGLLRARGRTDGGFYTGSHGLIEQIAPFPAGEIAIEQPPGTDLADGQTTIAFGMFANGAASAPKTFTIRNTGADTLTLGTITKDGTNAADFTVNTAGMAASLPSTGSTTFTITFTPGGAGARVAAIHVASGDYDENPFDIALAGTGTNPTDANLASLTLSSGALVPVFSAVTTSYTASVGYMTSSITVTPAVADPGATVTVNGTPVTSGSASAAIALNVGANTITTLVTASNGTTTKTYTVTVTRAAAVTGDVDLGYAPAANGTVLAAAQQPDGKIIFAGEFGALGGAAHALIGRVNADGTMDSAFNPQAGGSLGGNVQCIVVQADGRIVIGGDFGSINSIARGGIARLNADGTLDSGFNPNTNGDVLAIAAQADGKLVIGGSFSTVGGTARGAVARLNADGTLDTAFNPGANGAVDAIVVQPDGKILLAGGFSTVASAARNSIARLQAGGTIDAAFNPNASGTAHCLLVQADGKILAGGYFTAMGGVPRNHVARLNADGSLDAAFNPTPSAPFSGTVSSLAVQADGRIVFGGTFTSVAGIARNYIARVLPDGSLDASFNPDASSYVHCVTVQGDGKVVLGGIFGAMGGVARSGIARIHNDAATQTLSAPSAAQALWTRGGAAPELSAATFEISTNGGGTWTPLGAASRVGTSANWQLTGLSLPASGQLRARGQTLGGYRTGSRGLIEQTVSFNFSNPDADGDGLLDAWEITHFGTTTGHGPLDDFDHDGYNELLELALGLSPVTPNAGGLPPMTVEGGYLTLTVTKQAGVTYQVQSAGTLIAAQPDSFSAASTTVLLNNTTTLKVRDNFLTTAAARRFIRLHVTAAP